MTAAVPMNYLELLRLAAPEAILVVTALLVLTLGLTSSQRGILSPIVAALGLTSSAAAIFLLPANASFLGGMLVISPLNSLFQVICLALAFFTVLLVRGDRFALRNESEFLGLILLATVGLLLLIGSEELLMIFIGLELTGLSLYVMAAFEKNDRASAEAGLKYFLFGSTTSAFTLFGLSLIYGMAGTTALATIGENLRADALNPLLAAGIVMTLIGFFFKVAGAPFHLWAPDTYQGAPIPSAAFIASGSKVASFVVLGKILFIGFAGLHGAADWRALVPGWSPLLALIAAFSILLGNLVALAQKNVRRLLAYSAVAHAGYTLLGFVAGGRDGISATLFYTTIYALTLIGAFGVVGFVRRETGGDDLSNFVGLRERSPLLAGCMTIFMLSLAGLPPLAGFFGKFFLFSAAFRSGGNHGLLWLVAVGLFGSLISLYYYLIVLQAVFTDGKLRTIDQSIRSTGAFQKLVVSLLGLLVLLLGLLPGALVDRILAVLP